VISNIANVLGRKQANTSKEVIKGNNANRCHPDLHASCANNRDWGIPLRVGKRDDCVTVLGGAVNKLMC